jgi:hypothetical protein
MGKMMSYLRGARTCSSKSYLALSKPLRPIRLRRCVFLFKSEESPHYFINIGLSPFLVIFGKKRKDEICLPVVLPYLPKSAILSACLADADGLTAPNRWKIIWKDLRRNNAFYYFDVPPRNHARFRLYRSAWENGRPRFPESRARWT